VLYFDYIPWWGALVISVGIGLISMAFVQFILVPYEKKRIVGEFSLTHSYYSIDSLLLAVIERPPAKKQIVHLVLVLKVLHF
jgi:hypothetical protein